MRTPRPLPGACAGLRPVGPERPEVVGEVLADRDVDGNALDALLRGRSLLFALDATAVVAGGLDALGGYPGVVARERSDEDGPDQ